MGDNQEGSVFVHDLRLYGRLFVAGLGRVRWIVHVEAGVEQGRYLVGVMVVVVGYDGIFLALLRPVDPTESLFRCSEEGVSRPWNVPPQWLGSAPRRGRARAHSCLLIGRVA